MDPVQFQNIFALLSTCDAERARFRAGPTAYAAERLTGVAARTLASVDPEALDRFAASLIRKRWAALARVIPLTVRVVPSLEERYRRWLGGHPSPGDRMGLSPGESEALRSLLPLRAELLADDGEAPWAADLLAFEVLRACSRRDGRLRRLQSVWPLDALVEILQNGEIPLDPEPGAFAWQFR